MAEKGEQRNPKHKPSLREILASPHRAQLKELNESDRWGTSSGQKEPDPLSRNRSRWRTSPGSRSRFSSGRLSTLCSGREGFRPDWAEKNPGNETSSHSLKADLSTCRGTSPVCYNRTRVENENQPGLSSGRVKLSDPKDENRHNGRHSHSPVKTRSRSRSLSPLSRAAHNAKQDSDSKDTDRWHKALDQTVLDARHPTKPNDFLANRGSNRWSGGPSAFRSRDRSLSTEDKRKRNGRDSSRSPEHKWRKTGPYPNRSRCSERGVSSENRPRKTGWGRGRSRGRGSTGSSRLSRWSGGPSAFRSRHRNLSTEDKRKRNGRDSSRSPEHKWRKTGLYPNRSRCSERGVSSENRPRKTGWGRGRSRGRGSTGSSRLSRLNRSPGVSPTVANNTKDEREKKIGFSCPQKNMKQTMSAKPGQSGAGQPMPEKREEKKDPNPSVWDNLAQTQGAPSQNNDGWGQSINNDVQRKSDGSGTSHVQPHPHLSTPSSRTSSGRGRGRIKRNARMSCKWPPIHLMKSISRGANTPRDKTNISSAGRQTDHPSWWGLAAPNMDDSRSRSLFRQSQVAHRATNDADQTESDGWGQNSSPVKKSRSRSVSPWSQAAVDINKNFNNMDTDGWGTTLDQTGPDAWNQPSSNLSPDRGFKRRGVQEPRDQSRSPAPKRRRTGWDLARSRGRDSIYSPDYKQRPGWKQGGSRYRGRGRTNSPYRCQKRREKRDPSYSPISRSRRSPGIHRSPQGCLFQMPVSDGTIRSTPSVVPEERFSNTDAAKELKLCTDTQVSTSCSRRPDTESELSAVNRMGPTPEVPKLGQSQPNQTLVVPNETAAGEVDIHSRSPHGCLFQMPVSDGTIRSTPSAVPEERFSITDAAMELKLCTDTKVSTSCSRGPDTEYELSAVNRMGPTPEVPDLGQLQPNQTLVVPNETAAGEVDIHSFKRALSGFAKPKLRPFWVKQHLNDIVYWHILHRFVNNVAHSLGTRMPQTHENISKFVKENNRSLSSLLKMYLRRFVNEGIIKKEYEI